MASRKRSGAPADDSPAPPADDLIWGINAVWEALQQEKCGISEVLVQQGKAGSRLQQIIDLARDRAISLRFVDPVRLPVPSSCRHQGVVARQSGARLLPFAELLDGLPVLPEGPMPRILALDSIQDPRNLGSILRSALAAGFDRVLLTRDRSAPLTGTVARTSAGAVAYLQLAQVGNLSEALKMLKERGFWIYGAVAEPQAESIYRTVFSGAICVVIGSEGKGIRPLVRRQCDLLVTIPMQAEFNSLNASVAAAVVMFEIARQTAESVAPHGESPGRRR